MSTEILDLKKKKKKKEIWGHTNNNFEIFYALASYVNSIHLFTGYEDNKLAIVRITSK
jgi:hypothetical protein